MKIRMPEVYYEVKKFLKHKNEMDALYQAQLVNNKGKQVQYWNWWDDKRNAYWLQQFMESRGILKNTDKTIALCSVFEEREVLERVKADVRIFFSGENLHNPHFAEYADYMLSEKHPFDLGIGFDEFENNRYIRFPLWLIYMFGPDATEEDICNRCEQLRYPETGPREKFACLIARADTLGIRTDMYNAISCITSVDCPSGLFHNDESLVNEYKDDKVAYMRQYLFNICPENSNAWGYTTEKIFEAIAAGCIPVYLGSYNQPEPKILNPDAIIFWNKKNGGKQTIELIKELNTHPKQKEAFLRQPRLLPEAEDYVIAKFAELDKRIRELV